MSIFKTEVIPYGKCLSCGEVGQFLLIDETFENPSDNWFQRLFFGKGRSYYKCNACGSAGGFIWKYYLGEIL